MKRHIVTVSLLFISLSLYCEDEFIGLSNKSTKNENEVITKVEDKNTNNLEDIMPNKSLIPKSVYIGKLGDFNSVDVNRNEVLLLVDSFLSSLKSNKDLVEIDPGFLFIFNNVYSETILKNRNDLKYWYLGYVDLEDNRASTKIELHFNDKIYIGSIYLEKDRNWLITDFQLEIQKKGYFDPSSFQSN